MDFRLKPTTFFGRPVAIICQNENGPCPLIAIANVLSLRGKLSISTDRSFISLDEVIQLVADEVFESSAPSSSQPVDEETRNQQCADILNVLPKLARGLDVNIQFKGVNKYEYTEEMSIFDSLGIPLLHGWVYDPKEARTAEVIGDQSYNHLIYKMVDYRSLDLSAPQADGKLAEDGPVIEAFLAASASQLTYTGLLKLYEFMNDRQLAVFFRNNHFSTLFALNGQLFVLVTDLGYLHQPAVIWEALEALDGQSEFYSDAFIPLSQLPSGMVHDTPQPTPREGTIALPPGVPAAGDRDITETIAQPRIEANEEEPMDPSLLLAMQLQQEEDELAMASSSEEPSPVQPPPPTAPPHSSPAHAHAPAPVVVVSPIAVTLTPQPAMPQESSGPQLSPEEMDRQMALMLYYEQQQQMAQQQQQQQQQSPRSNPRGAAAQHAAPPPKQKSSRHPTSTQASSPSCAVC